MRPIPRLFIVAVLAALLGVGAWMASRSTAPDIRDGGALMSVVGDAARGAVRPALDLTRVSPGEEAAIGAAVDRTVLGRMGAGGAPGDAEYVARVFRRITPHVSREGILYTVAIVSGAEVNAFAVAGGRIYLTEGMIGFIRSEAELAGVLGHEIAHVDRRHCVERLQLARAAGRAGRAPAVIASLGYEVMLRGFSEEQELEADSAGAVLAGKAGYDPWAGCFLFPRLAAGEEEGKPSRPKNPAVEAVQVVSKTLRRYLETHPPVAARIEAIRRRLLEEPQLWKGARLYSGEANFASRRALPDEPVEREWIVRTKAPDLD